MYICNECGVVFEEPDVERDVHYWLDGCPAEEHLICPSCGENSFSEALECEGCGCYFSSESDNAYIDEKGDKYCTASCALLSHGIRRLHR